MKATLGWLKEFVDITLPANGVADRLTMAGLEVDKVTVTGGDWDNVLVGQIKAIIPHPNADRLTLPTVDLGGEEVTVVCGAPNLEIGLKVVFARVGATLIDAHTGKLAVLKAAKIRGIASSGMVCSEKELGISDSHLGILVLPDDAQVGTPLADYMGDTVFDLDVTPNRPDCLSVTGIAREIAALTGEKTNIKEVSYPETGPDIKGLISIEIKAPDLCPRYCASLVTGVAITESPQWMQRRLLACGMRPINNIVDITNYVMLEYGQPLHAFDYDNISGKKIIIRRAGEGEKFRTLDDVERTLSSESLVIADGEQSVAIAGVMGGANSEVEEKTTSILLEAASFNPASIHFTGRTLGLSSEACMRFERGISPGLAIPALRRATQLLIELGGGQAAAGVIDIYPGKEAPSPVSISIADVKRILGIDVTIGKIEEALTALGFLCSHTAAKEELSVIAPYWRSDVRLTVDLVEEVARIVGYDNIPATMLSQAIPRQSAKPIFGLKREVGRLFAGYGFQELITYSLTSLEVLNKLSTLPYPVDPPPLRLSNPMSVEQEYLRPSLRANLLAAVSSNRKHEDGGIRLFELGKVYLPRDNDLPEEREVLCGLMSGPRLDKSWQDGDESIDFFDAKGVVEGLLSRWSIAATFGECLDHGLHSTKRATIISDGVELGVIGQVHPEVLKSFEIDEPVYLIDIDLPALLPFTTRNKTYQPVSRFPAIYRDLALVVDIKTAYRQIVALIESYPLVRQVDIFDVYSGEQVPAGKKSLAYRITFQSNDHTLTDKEVDKVEKQILKKLSAELGATLRG